MAVTSSLSGEGYSSNIVSFSFGSPVSASAVSKTIIDTKATEDKKKISMPTLSGSGKNNPPFGSLAAISSLKSSGGGFAA